MSRKRLSQNFSFWESNLGFRGKSGLLAAFSKVITENNRVLGMARKLLIVLAAAALFTSGFSGCAKKKADAGQIRVVLDWTPNTNHTGLYAALEKGWFADEGLAVEIMQPPEDGALVLLASGNAEFAVDFQESLGPAIARDRDALPVTAVAAIISHNTSGLMALSESGIKTPRDLEGRRFASWDTPLVTAIIRNIVEADGGDFSRVKMIPNFATDVFSALETNVDSVWIYYAWDGIAAELRGTAVNYLDLGKLNPDFDFYTPVLVSNSAWAQKNPGLAKKFLKAASRGYTFAMENPGEAAEILLKHAPELDFSLVMASQNYLASRYKGDAKRWGEIDPARWAAFYRWMYREGLLEKDIGEGGFTNEYLP
jgi:ABC-type nitrate/sulfonate/bicarbonate transport system substrate-binding protein